MDNFRNDEMVFVNLHPRDLEDEQLGSDSDPLSDHADRVVLEVTERATLDGIRGVGMRLDVLRRRGFRIAVDDLGSGYAGLNSFVKLRPEIVKIDMTLVRDVDTDPKRRNIVGSILAMCSSLDVRPVVEGVETDGETRALVELGADLMQGYAFARPRREIESVSQDVAAKLRQGEGQT
jgi:EAL domain-containing protein (putative c-di-GMP-specific phosphodiesterase class I)